MAVLLTGKDAMFAKLAAARIPHIGTPDQFGDRPLAVGIATGPEPTDTLLAVTVFHDYKPQYGHCQISMASWDSRWAGKATIRSVLALPFFPPYSVNKVWVAIPSKANANYADNRVVKFVKAIGFVHEATLKDHYGKGTHCVILRMMARDYDRLYLKAEAKAA